VALFQKPMVLMEALPPLWSRQILGTMANFLTFEHSAHAIYQQLECLYEPSLDGVAREKGDYSIPTQLAVTFTAGFISGMVSTIVSHPADTLLSLKARHPHATLTQLIHQVGWKSLATKGLGPRMGLTGSIIGFQWFAYDTFKTSMGMGTTGR
jgi:solute carrier family 25 (mitochondrial phosphate transporter), member 3